jgi:hypothetical protein
LTEITPAYGHMQLIARKLSIWKGETLMIRLIKEYIYCYAGDCHTTGKTPVVRNDTHYDQL